MPQRTSSDECDRDLSQAGLVADSGNSIALDENESLHNKLQSVERERDEHVALLQRTQSDFANYQKRVQREMADERRHACSDLARELLPVLDNLRQAVQASQQTSDVDSLVLGVSMVESQLLDVLRRFHITPIDALGEPFDPSVHEAVLQHRRDEVPPGTVVEVFEPGFRHHERLLRPARVAVSTAWKE